MSDVTLRKTEEKILTEAAGRESGLLQLPESLKEVTRHRLLGKLESATLIAASAEHDGAPALTPAGYRAVGLRPPRAARTRKDVEPSAKANPTVARSGTKQQLIVSLLGREEGASLDELIAATGWLPHTTRAALSRLRSAGQDLLKSTREDGRTAYRIAVNEPEPKRRSRPRKPAGADQVAAA